MDLITYFEPAPPDSEVPDSFPSPFQPLPHPLARRACDELQTNLGIFNDIAYGFNTEKGGKMFGVLIIRDQNDRLGFISAFSGMLNGSWDMDGFVPPIFDQDARNTFLPAGETQLAKYAKDITSTQNSASRQSLSDQLAELKLQFEDAQSAMKETHQQRKTDRHKIRGNLKTSTTAQLSQLGFESQQDKRERQKLKDHWQTRIKAIQKKKQLIDAEIEDIKQLRRSLSRRLHERVFSGYTLSNTFDERHPITCFFDSGLPPGGAGDCAGPKLLHYALHHNLTPLALAEFWWGTPPADGVRHHGQYYPACRGKCHPILPFMLKGLPLDAEPDLDEHISEDALATVYEDDDLLVVNKPAGLLSIPGKSLTDSVLTRLQKRYPQATGPLLIHRLDMHTSGLLLAAKNQATHKALQKQFLNRSIEKRYVALLSKHQPAPTQTTADGKGLIELPLRVDLDDRPRQIVCEKHGKAATTHWEIVNYEQDQTRVRFYPITGRTHQLRVHAAHIDGLNNPIVGDQLYGRAAKRLMLHATYLSFTHPQTGKRIILESQEPF